MKPTPKASRPAKSIDVARTMALAAAANPVHPHKGTSMKNMLRRRRPAEALPATIPGHSPVRMDGECLLPAGGEPLHGPCSSQVPEATCFAASHIEPIESEA